MAGKARSRSDVQQQVADLLLIAKRSLGLSVSFLSRLDGTTQHLEVVESSVPFLFQEGNKQPQATSLCQAILDKKLPPVIPDLKAFPEAMKLPAARLPRIRSYVSVPVRLSDGTVYGTFCAAGLTSDKGLTKRDQSLMEVLAHAAAVIIEPDVRDRARQTEIAERLAPIVAAGGPAVVLQPIVDLATGQRVGAEALSRFPIEWGKAPDVCFEEAHSIGAGDRLELLALRRAAGYLDEVTGYVAMNVSPGTLLTPECTELLREFDLGRVLLELSEHDKVADYAELMAVLDPLRAAGMRLAIDDVGAGFSSLRHIILTAPDVIKLDRSIVDGVSSDPVLRSLVGSLVDFAGGCDARVVAEGIETAADGDILCALGVDYGQGWYYGRPGAAADLPAAAVLPVASAVDGLRPQNVGGSRHRGAHDDFAARSSHRDLSST
jgi:EAL domain-containing protein (putative c-di-GMP-specific phosphodiesterase class I)